MRTQEEINRQIEGLLREKKSSPKVSVFGRATHEGIDVQIQILRENQRADDYADADEFSDYVYNQATLAGEWMESSMENDLFSDL